MFCTKCGKKLHEGDIFCAHCGTKVREDLLFKSEVKPAPRSTRYDDVVFNPPFKAEAERRTQHIEETSPYSNEPKKERVEFNWNLDGFPVTQRKKDDDFVINWDSVIEKKKEERAVTVEKILPDLGFKEETESLVEKAVEKEVKDEAQKEPQKELQKEADKTPQKEEVLSIEALEEALFGTSDFDALDENAQGVTIEYKTFKERKKGQEFYTYNAHKDAFQELLDRERARLEELESERESQWEELTSFVPTLKFVDVVVPPLTAGVMADDPMNIIEPEYQVVLPPLTARVDAPEVSEPEVGEADETSEASEPVETVEEKTEEAGGCPFLGGEDKGADSGDQGRGEEGTGDEAELSEETKEKTKLRYSDVFPADAFDSVGDDQPHKRNKKKIDKTLDEILSDDDDDDDDEGGNFIIKALIVLLAIVVIIEIGVIGVKFIAPESDIALKIDGLMDKVTGIFSGEDERTVPSIEIEQNLVEKYVKELSSEAKNIGSVDNNATMKYDLSKAHSFAEIGQTNEFQDVAWNSVDNKTNGYLIVKAIISYYDAWKANNPESTVVGINQVTIGEIRTGSSGYYVLNKVIYAQEGETIEKYETIYLEASQDKITVKEVKEETL